MFELRNGALRLTPLVAAAPERKRTSPIPIPGIESIPATKPPLSRHLASFRTAGDTTGAIATYEFRYHETREVSASVRRSLSSVDAEVSATVGVTGSVKLSMALKAGYDYELYATANGPGIGWSFA